MKAKLKSGEKLVVHEYFGCLKKDIDLSNELFSYEDYHNEDDNYDMIIFSDHFENNCIFVKKKYFDFVEDKPEPFKFEYNVCSSRKLFSPLNDKAKDLCKFARRKNLTIEQMEFYIDNGYDVEITAQVDIGEKLIRCFKMTLDQVKES